MYESRENYLETIFILHKRNGKVRAIDIAKELGFSKPSVSRAVGLLKSDNYINIHEDGSIVLNKIGLEKAKIIYEKHQIITQFYIEILGVSSEVAEKDACKMEHIISDELFDAMKNFLNKNKTKSSEI